MTGSSDSFRPGFRPGVRLGVDVGEVRVGVAVCDEAGVLATPVETVRRGRGDIARLVELVEEYAAIEVVVGLPLSLSGASGTAAGKATSFAERVADEIRSRGLTVSVRLSDERLTTVSAERVLRERGRTGAKRRAVVDQAAAVVILQHALDSERTNGGPTGSGSEARLVSDLGLGTEQPGERRARPRRFGGCLAVVVALAIIVAIGAVVYVKGVDLIKGWVDSTTVADYQGSGHGAVVVQVKSGQTAADIGATLEKAGVVKSAQAFADAAKGKEASLQVGYYRMHRQMSGAAAVQLMLSPTSRISTGITVPEGLRAKEILALIVDHSKFTAAALNQAYSNTKALGLPSYAKGDPEGYLYPATYPLTPGSSPASLLTDMTTRFAQEAETVKLTQGAAALHLSPTDVVIVASLVQAEASRPQDMPKVARVIYNRLKINMALQLDSTLHYAINSRGLVQADQELRQLKSPYNSYTHTGLPPTPIDSPGELALQAALHPATGTWRYFVTVNLTTGKTLFATTFQEHEHNRAIYLQYCASHPSC